ncbi:MAG: alpha/beta hydrolase [Tannerellaceae bacterium]|jgi:acetyl esterase/lipase|nr:alpha/beta hydrolase [Tannerellaceae bacterium]
MKHFLLFLALPLCLVLKAQEPTKQLLWPKEVTTEAELFVYRPAEATLPSPAVLICPGGGYSGLAIDHEGHAMAKWYVSQGFVAVVLKYRMPKGAHTLPLADAEKAIATIRSQAKEWKLNPQKVGVIGSSAGGHLAASLSTLAAGENRPDFAILYYPVISFAEETTHGGSRKNLLGEAKDNQTLIERYSLDKQVDSKTPQTLLLLSDDDKVVLPKNSLLYYEALKEKNIAAALYLFPIGGHGWGFNTSFIYHEDVKQLIQKWLKEVI